jgi:hypothetical protein
MGRGAYSTVQSSIYKTKRNLSPSGIDGIDAQFADKLYLQAICEDFSRARLPIR